MSLSQLKTHKFNTCLSENGKSVCLLHELHANILHHYMGEAVCRETCKSYLTY